MYSPGGVLVQFSMDTWKDLIWEKKREGNYNLITKIHQSAITPEHYVTQSVT